MKISEIDEYVKTLTLDPEEFSVTDVREIIENLFLIFLILLMILILIIRVIKNSDL